MSRMTPSSSSTSTGFSPWIMECREPFSISSMTIHGGSPLLLSTAPSVWTMLGCRIRITILSSCHTWLLTDITMGFFTVLVAWKVLVMVCDLAISSDSAAMTWFRETCERPRQLTQRCQTLSSLSCSSSKMTEEKEPEPPSLIPASAGTGMLSLCGTATGGASEGLAAARLFLIREKAELSAARTERPEEPGLERVELSVEVCSSFAAQPSFQFLVPGSLVRFTATLDPRHMAKRTSPWAPEPRMVGGSSNTISRLSITQALTEARRRRTSMTVMATTHTRSRITDTGTTMATSAPTLNSLGGLATCTTCGLLTIWVP
mmetsp:Transcript_8110/g.22929  ORF Transcript_8110/g.22929 Transcript_8110/m.22929 type:complete len:318 (+) Transcript_8110:2112-3065(+)